MPDGNDNFYEPTETPVASYDSVARVADVERWHSTVAHAGIPGVGDEAVPATVFYGEEDPGAVGAGAIWLKPASDRLAIFVRNAADDGWSTPIFQDVGDGEARVQTQAGNAILSVEDDNGATSITLNEKQNLIVASSTDDAALVALQAQGDTGTNLIEITPLDIIITGLPSADPEVAGALFTSGAPGAADPKALMVSGGPAA